MRAPEPDNAPSEESLELLPVEDGSQDWEVNYENSEEFGSMAGRQAVEREVSYTDEI